MSPEHTSFILRRGKVVHSDWDSFTCSMVSGAAPAPYSYESLWEFTASATLTTTYRGPIRHARDSGELAVAELVTGFFREQTVLAEAALNAVANGDRERTKTLLLELLRTMDHRNYRPCGGIR